MTRPSRTSLANIGLRISICIGTIIGTIVVSGCEKRCEGLADCGIGELCDADGFCIPEPARGEGEGEGEGQEGEGEGEPGEGEGEGGAGLCGGGRDTFDPDEIVGIGLLQAGIAASAVAAIDDVSNYAVGFDGCAQRDELLAKIRDDGRLVMPCGFGDRVVVFNADAHPAQDNGDDRQNGLDCVYPDDPHANDDVLPTNCAGLINGIWFRPNSNDLYVQCDDFTFTGPDGVIDTGGRFVLGVDASENILVIAGDGLSGEGTVAILAGANEIAVPELDGAFIGERLVRTDSDGFLIAAHLNVGGFGGPAQLLFVGADGALEERGTFDTGNLSGVQLYGAMDADGNIYTAEGFTGVRLAPDGSASVAVFIDADPFDEETQDDQLVHLTLALFSGD